MENVKLVVCDVDGTLYGPERVLTERTRKAIEAIREKGILFGLASGREIHNMRVYPSLWGFQREFDVYIGMNGAHVYDYNHDVKTMDFVMNFKQAEAVFKHVEQFDLNCSIFCDDNTLYVYKLDEEARKSMERNKEGVHFQCIEKDLSRISHLGFNKLCFRIEPERMPLLEKYMKENPLEGYVGFKTQPMYYEIMLQGANKAVGLKKYCQMNNITLDQVVAFGDTTNDNELLACCYGICLKNGTDDTRSTLAGSLMLPN